MNKKDKPSKNSTTKQKLSHIEEKLLNEIRYLGKSISIVDDYYLKLKHIPTRKGEFPELIVMDPTSGAIPREPLKQVQEKYPEWYEAWRQVVQPAGKFYKIYNRLKDELRPILKTNYDAFYNLEDLYWWHINEDNNNLLDKIQKIRVAIIELRDKKKGEVELQQRNSENINAEVRGKKKNSFDDVKLKMNVDWKGNYSNSHYEVSVTCNNHLDNEFNLAFRFMPVLYLLVKGVNENITCVRNKELKNAYRDPDEAKKEIIKAFTRVIGQRAKKIIKIEHGIGKKLMVPRKNITLKLQKPVA